MKNADMMTTTILPNGNTVYSLKTYTGKCGVAAASFFGNEPTRQAILKQACGEFITDMNSAEEIYNRLASHAYRLFSPFMFILNFHNFVAFLQQFKAELENIGIKSFLPARERSAQKVFSIEFDPNGVQVEAKPKRKRTHYEDTSNRLFIMDAHRRSEYFNRLVATDKRDLKDDTIVVRSDDGSTPVLFFNVMKGDINVPAELTSTTDIKAYEVDRIKCLYANITGINYMKARPITYKSWSKLTPEKKVGTKVSSISPEVMKSIAFTL